jgi:hypothetical protein
MTEADVAVAVIVTLTLIIIIQIFGLMEVEIAGLISLDPWGWVGGGAATTLLLSIGNHLRPLGNNGLILKGLIAKRVLLPRGDRIYWPSPAQIGRREREARKRPPP